MRVTAKTRIAAAVVFAFTASAFLSGCCKEQPQTAAAPAQAPVQTQTKPPAVHPKPAAPAPSRPAVKTFASKAEIKKEYGRLEVVTLRDGRRFEGAVVSTGETYVMVTVGGTETFPMAEVQARDIVR